MSQKLDKTMRTTVSIVSGVISFVLAFLVSRWMANSTGNPGLGLLLGMLLPIGLLTLLYLSGKFGWFGIRHREKPDASAPAVALSQEEQKTLEHKNGNRAIASLVLGISGLVAWCLPPLGLAVGIIGLVMGIKGLKSANRGMAIAGIILSSFCLLFSLINGILGGYFAYQEYLQKTGRLAK